MLISSCYCQLLNVCSLVPVCLCVYFCVLGGQTEAESRRHTCDCFLFSEFPVCFCICLVNLTYSNFLTFPVHFILRKLTVINHKLDDIASNMLVVSVVNVSPG